MTLNFFADLASILALLVTGFNAYQIANVKRRIVSNLTLVPLLDQLLLNSSEMNRYLQLYGHSMDHFDEVIGKCEANVRALRRRLGTRHTRFCNNILTSMKIYRKGKNRDAGQAVYVALQQVIQEIENRAEEIRITGP